MKIDALEQAMAAYQQAGNQAGVLGTSKRILDLDSSNVRALAIVTFIERAQATSTGDSRLAAQARSRAEIGLKSLPSWPKPEGMSDAEFDRLRSQMAEIFNGAAGFGALQSKDYETARAYYLKSVQIDPDNMQDLYQLAVANLQMSPLDADGFWYAGRAIQLARAQKNAAAEQSIASYGKAKYRAYHGSDEGWDALVAATAGQKAPPADFARSISRAPAPSGGGR